MNLRRLSAALLAGAGLLFVAPTVPANAVVVDPTSLAALVDGIVPAQLAKEHIPGAAVVVVSGGKTVFQRGYGVADTDTKRPVDATKTQFFTGSLAKLFTTQAVLQLVQAGKLDLHTDVNQYLKTFKIKNTYPGRPVTIDQLLTYTAGFDDDIVGLGVTEPAQAGDLAKSLADRQPARVRPPGTKVAYNNYGLALAGYLVELASGQSFARYVEQHVLKPAGMSSSTVAETDGPELAHGYRPSGNTVAVEHGQYGPWAPAGTGPVTTAADMGRYLQTQLSGDPIAQLMQAQHYTQDKRLPGMGYAFEERPYNGRPLAFKDGDVPGFHGVMALLPEQKFGIYVVYNGDGLDGTASWSGVDLTHKVIDKYFPNTQPAPRAVGGEVSSYAGTYRSARVSHNSLQKVAALFATPSVEAGPDGTLTTTGLSIDPARATQHWYQTSPGLFQEKGGPDRIAFDNGTLTDSANPSEALEKLSWYDEPALHQGLLGVGALLLVIGWIVLSLIALVRVLRRRPKHPGGARVARLMLWLTGLLATVFLAGIAAAMADSAAVTELVTLNPPRFAVLPFIATAALICALVALVLIMAVWWRGWWTRTGRIAYTVVALAAIPFFKIVMVYNLVVLPFPTN